MQSYKRKSNFEIFFFCKRSKSICGTWQNTDSLQSMIDFHISYFRFTAAYAITKATTRFQYRRHHPSVQKAGFTFLVHNEKQWPGLAYPHKHDFFMPLFFTKARKYPGPPVKYPFLF